MLRMLIVTLALCLVGCASAEQVAAYKKHKEDLIWLELSQLKFKENNDCYNNYSEVDALTKCGSRYVIHDPRLDPVRTYDDPPRTLTSTIGSCGYGVCRSTTIVNGAIINSTEIHLIQSSPSKSYHK